MPRIKGWTKLNPEELWQVWRDQFQSDQEATATAIWIGNRLVKERAQSTRRKFYSLKDAWIEHQQENLVEGRVARRESTVCRVCNGKGKFAKIIDRRLTPDQEQQVWYWLKQHCEGDPPEGVRVRWVKCRDCDGTGEYRVRWLYLHVFDIEGQRYSFHSYEKPTKLSDEPGEDLERYGGRFTEEELQDLALPISGILKVLGYIAHERWGLSFNIYSGRYVAW